jgi:regulatory protein YycH of two-component signal transduction system YycFG
MNKKILLVLLVLIVLIVSVFIWVFEREPQDKSVEIETKIYFF